MAREQQYPLRFEPEERAAWQAAADRAELPLSQWIRAACNAAAKLSPFNPYPETVLTPEQAEGAAQALLGQSAESLICPHPVKERTSYGVCRLCKAVVVP